MKTILRIALFNFMLAITGSHLAAQKIEQNMLVLDPTQANTFVANNGANYEQFLRTSSDLNNQIQMLNCMKCYKCFTFQGNLNFEDIAGCIAQELKKKKIKYLAFIQNNDFLRVEFYRSLTRLEKLFS